MQRPYLSVVIPAYNEERRLKRTLEGVLEYLSGRPYPYEVILVDDGSTDGTAAIAAQWQQRHRELQLLEEEHRGKGYAVRQGMLRARGEVVLFTDADLSVPMAELERLLPHLEEGYDVVIGSREGLGARRVGEPAYRHLMGRVFNFIIRLVTVSGIQDTQCGFKLFRGEVVGPLFGALRLYGEGSPVVQRPMVTAFDVEVLYLARRMGLRVREVPVEWHYGTHTKVDPLRDSLRNLQDVLRVRWQDLRGAYNGQLPEQQEVESLQEG